MSRDYAYEALAEATGTDWTTGRGELNAALKSIRGETEETDSYLLADMIHERAKMYRQVMPDVLITPSALAKHWRRVLEESERRERPQGYNRPAAPTSCGTCDGDRFVLVGLRGEYEEMAPCPDCNPIVVEFWRCTGTKFVSMDPALARERMAG